MHEARLRAALVVGATVSQERMAALVSAELPRGVHQTQWDRYEKGASEPPLDVIEATAKVSGLTAAYIAFGVTDAGLLLPDPTKDRKLTDAEIDRAIAQSQRDAAAKKAQKKNAGRKQA